MGFTALLGLGQGATEGLGIYYTMARAPDSVTAASLSAVAPGAGYLLPAPGRWPSASLHDATGRWTLPGLVLLAVSVLTPIVGWLGGRARTVPATPSGADESTG